MTGISLSSESAAVADKLALAREIGARVREIREARKPKKITQIELSKATGLSQKVISDLEKGKQQWLSYQIQLVAAALGVSPRDLLPGGLSPDEAALVEAYRLEGAAGAMALLIPKVRNK